MIETKNYVSLLYCDSIGILQRLESYGRVCYKSESKITNDSADEFIKRLIKDGHESVLEHESASLKIVCDRGVSHEIVRHRIGSYSQESTRYCNYSNNRFDNQIKVIPPSSFRVGSEEESIWHRAMIYAENSYMLLLDAGVSAQEARSVLPTCLKTELVVTYNIREWRHFLKLRTDAAAHPSMREVALMCLEVLRGIIPVVFDDIAAGNA